METLKKVTILGGDERSCACANNFFHSKTECAVFGLENAKSCCLATKCATLYDAIYKSDVIILPLPTSKDNTHIFTPFSEEKITIKEVMENIGKETIIFAGNPPEILYKLAEKNKNEIINYCDDEVFAISGAVSSAEGTLKEIIGLCKKNLSETKILVCGYGRIGKNLSRLLRQCSATVFVSARKPEDFALIKANGLYGINTYSIAEIDEEFDIIINTIPYMIFDEKTLLKIKGNPYLLELASKPYGIDFNIAEKLGFNVISLHGIPGKIAPISSGEAIFNCVKTNLLKREVIV